MSKTCSLGNKVATTDNRSLLYIQFLLRASCVRHRDPERRTACEEDYRALIDYQKLLQLNVITKLIQLTGSHNLIGQETLLIPRSPFIKSRENEITIRGSLGTRLQRRLHKHARVWRWWTFEWVDCQSKLFLPIGSRKRKCVFARFGLRSLEDGQKYDTKTYQYVRDICGT